MIYKAKMPEAYARVEWCTERFGPGDVFQWTLLRWWRRGGYLHFRYEKDYILYTLRWA